MNSNFCGPCSRALVPTVSSVSQRFPSSLPPASDSECQEIPAFSTASSCQSVSWLCNSSTAPWKHILESQAFNLCRPVITKWVAGFSRKGSAKNQLGQGMRGVGIARRFTQRLGTCQELRSTEPSVTQSQPQGKTAKHQPQTRLELGPQQRNICFCLVSGKQRNP